MGLDYGIYGSSELMEGLNAYKLLTISCANNFNHIDTAQAYGFSEERIGDFFKNAKVNQIPITTKLPPYPQDIRKATALEVTDWIDESIKESINKLQPALIDTVLVHNWSDIEDFSGDYLEILRLSCNRLGIQKIGVSIYEIDELVTALRLQKINHIQIPLNIIDYRISGSQDFLELISNSECKIHVRSIFLQGLLLSDGKNWPQNARIDINILAKLDICVRLLEKQDRIDLIFSYLISFDWITSVILGVQTPDQLDLLIKKYKTATKLTEVQINTVRKVLGKPSDVLLDPRKWIND